MKIETDWNFSRIPTALSLLNPRAKQAEALVYMFLEFPTQFLL